jgi:hypothetical protein
MDQHQIDQYKDPDPHQRDKLDPYPHQIDKLEPDLDPYQVADKPKCMENEPI